MALDFLKFFDGTDKTPRDVQVQALEWVADNIGQTEVLVLRIPVGGGKSAISRAVQNITNAPVITPSNILIDQYVGDYPEVNSLKGRANYHCADGMCCQDVKEILKMDPCPGCPYVANRGAAIDGEATFYNPMSLYYTAKAKDWVRPKVIVVDEAHQLPSMILMMAGKKFDSERFDFDKRCTDPDHLMLWLRAQRGKLYRLSELYKKKGENKKAAEVERESENMRYTLQGLEEDPDNYAVWIEEGTKRGRKVRYLNVHPVTPPKFICKQMLDADRVILMSGTMFDHDIRDLLPGRHYEVLDLPSPIPAENRPVIWKPALFKMNWKTDLADVARVIRECIAANPGMNTIIHVSYDWSRKLAPFFPDAIINTAENKIEMLEEFKREGGIFLAGGCAEGLDLKYDLCGLNIIPRLLCPNFGDPVVKKRMAQEDGDEWYNLETLKVTIQQAGRSTRAEDDKSKCYVLDPGFLRRVKQSASKLPKSFLDAIVLEK